jgi:hypothetical protein
MLDLGEHQRVRDTRMFFRFMDTNQDVASEVFYLEPIPGA